MPNTRMPIMTSVVITGRRTKISETLTGFVVLQSRSRGKKDQGNVPGEPGEMRGERGEEHDGDSACGTTIRIFMSTLSPCFSVFSVVQSFWFACSVPSRP